MHMLITMEEFVILIAHLILYESRLYILNISIIRKSANIVYIYIYCAFVGLDHKLCKMGGTCIKILAHYFQKGHGCSFSRFYMHMLKHLMITYDIK